MGWGWGKIPSFHGANMEFEIAFNGVEDVFNIVPLRNVQGRGPKTPMGCMPLVRNIFGGTHTRCADPYNKVASSFNSKIKKELATIASTTAMKTAFVDAYVLVLDAVNHPQKFGLLETLKGCCGSGTIEYGDSCRGMSTCKDPSKYVFWDAVHPTQRMYKILADEAIDFVNQHLLG